MREYDEIVNASDKKILIALDAELEEISHKINEARLYFETSDFPWEREVLYENLERLIARHTGFYEARVIAYKAMQKRWTTCSGSSSAV